MSIQPLTSGWDLISLRFPDNCRRAEHLLRAMATDVAGVLSNRETRKNAPGGSRGAGESIVEVLTNPCNILLPLQQCCEGNRRELSSSLMTRMRYNHIVFISLDGVPLPTKAEIRSFEISLVAQYDQMKTAEKSSAADSASGSVPQQQAVSTR